MTPNIEPEFMRAERHKTAIAEALKDVIVAAENARKDGFFVEFNVGLNQYGTYAASPVSLIKRF